MSASIFSIDGAERHSNGDTTVNPEWLKQWGLTPEQWSDWHRAVREAEAEARRGTFRVVSPDRGRTEE